METETRNQKNVVSELAVLLDDATTGRDIKRIFSLHLYIALPAFYPDRRSLIGCDTCQLFCSVLISTVAWKCAVQNSRLLISLRFRSVCEDDLVE